MKLDSRTAKLSSPGQTLWDADVPGLHLRQRQTGAGYYLFYRTRDGRQRRPKLGDARVMPLTQARERARTMLLEVAGGGDPSGDTLSGRAAPTVADLCARYLADPHVLAKKSYRGDKLLIDKHILPRWTNRKVASMEAADFERLRKEMTDTPYLFNRTLALASTMFGRAEVWKLRPQGTKPTAGVHRYPEKKRRRYMKPAEAFAIAAILRREEDTNPASVAFIRLLILTGARPKEIAQARWEWIVGSVIHHPDSKTGERDIFLSPAAVEVIASLPRAFDTLTGILSPHKLWCRIRKEAACPDLRLYDLRHSFASVAVSIGMTLAQIGELLGHASTQTTARYAHLMDEHKQQAATATAAAITHYMGAQP